MLDLISIRRHLHQIPEIGLQEFETQKYLLEIIRELSQNKSFFHVKTWQTGILVFLKGSAPTKTVGSDKNGGLAY